ncbi:hypothetical protein Q1695_014596 [Nippostrongylus brasiliensis]|nr:hypothetical protein Q1695_014596 [Nippostrongylus brasiliensis]
MNFIFAVLIAAGTTVAALTTTPRVSVVPSTTPALQMPSTSPPKGAPGSAQQTTQPPGNVTPGKRKCGNEGDTEYCHYENSTELCDVCEGVSCPTGKKCVKQNGKCATECVCINNVDIEDVNGVCRNPCELHPCQNNGVCTADAALPSKFSCNCTKEFEGERCELYHNFCFDPAPDFCPQGEYKCVMNGFRNYTCNCAEGFYYNVTGKHCVKVGQEVKIILYFKQTPYSEIYNNVTHPEAISAKRTIQAAFEKIYGSNLIKLVFNKFTEGSLVAHMDLMLKLHDTGTFRNNEKIFKQFLVECDTSNRQCFGTLGNAYLPPDGWVAKDDRCGNVICPEYTQCRPIDGVPLRTECVCKSGFRAIGANADSQGRVIHTCQDIDECAEHPCETVEECVNMPGSFVCGGIPNNASCPKGSNIVVTGPFSYRCECSWIYAGSQCRYPLTLILLILACIFLLTTIVAVLYSIFSKRRNRTGTYQLYSVPDGMSSTKTVQSSWT